MKQRFPKMVYKTKESHKTVKNEMELEEALSDGFKLHWLDAPAIEVSVAKIEQIEAKIAEVDRKFKKRK
jgi:hypothetical protein